MTLQKKQLFFLILLPFVSILNNTSLANSQFCPSGMVMWQDLNSGISSCKCPSGHKISTDLAKKPGRIGGCGDVHNISTPKELITNPPDSLSLWLDANDPFGNGYLPKLNERITIWYDKSGKENHAIQNSATKTPSFTKVYNKGGNSGNSFNGHHAYVRNEIYFDGNDDELLIGNEEIVFTPGYNDYTLISVVKNNEINSTRGFFKTETGAFIIGSQIVSKTLDFFSQGTFRENWPDLQMRSSNRYLQENEYYIITIRYDNANQKSILRINGKDIDNSDGRKFSQSLNIITIGKGTNFWRGGINEIMAYQTNLSSPQIVILEEYLAAKWGVDLD